jgi:hypothetical protein
MFSLASLQSLLLLLLLDSKLQPHMRFSLTLCVLV